ncbi:MAG TPA: polyprenol phosphomannose-dependent alpha 1,6 mannosyltransferase MptB [Conexibacter sp.]|nr:polyprenol phosphomannose-dependent alpha 1,6 mannosyltransferase MptB [Conexibacter sp.]
MRREPLLATAGRRPSDDAEGPRALAPATLLGIAALAGLLAAGSLLAVAAASRRRIWFVPSSGRGGFPDWLGGPFRGLDFVLLPPRGALLIVVMLVCYLVVLACARVGGIPARLGVAAIVAVHVVFLLGPPLFSADVFGYVDYARLSVLHGLNPYLHGAADAALDPVVPFVRWHDIPTPYGPLFTVASAPLAWLSVPAALWVCKALAALLSLGCVALVWRIAQRRELPPTPAALFVGLNPLLLAYGVGGAHNDFLLMALALGAILLVLEERAVAGGGLGILAVGVKASAGLLLPFLLLGARRRRSALAGMLAGGAAVLALAVAAFGTEGFGFVGQIGRQQRFVAADSVPRRVAGLLGFHALPSGLRLLFVAAFATSVIGLLWATWRGRIDWIAAAGWATLALLLSTAWLVPWYVVWLLPLAAVARDPRLRGAALLFCVYVVATRVTYQLV